MLALAGCTGSGLGLRGVGAPSRQSLAAAEPPPQVVTSEFGDPDSTAPQANFETQDAALNAAPANASTTPVTNAPAAALQPPRKLAVQQPQTRPAPRAQTAPQPATPTLQSVAPPPAASDRFTPQPQMGDTRETAIRQMREKAAATDKKPPNVFDIPESRTQPLDNAERAELRRRLEAEADQNAQNVTLEEALRRQKDSERLSKKAGSHYKDALSSIEN